MMWSWTLVLFCIKLADKTNSWSKMRVSVVAIKFTHLVHKNRSTHLSSFDRVRVIISAESEVRNTRYFYDFVFLLLGMKCNKCMSWPVRKPRNSHGISAVILSTDHDHWTSAFGAEELRPISLEIASCRINRNININIDIMYNDFSWVIDPSAAGAHQVFQNELFFLFMFPYP